MAQTRSHRDFVSKVAETISRNSLLKDGDKVVVALSGGADSVALLAVLDELGYDCFAAHCNFHLRGEESQRDMRHAEAVCLKLGIGLTVKDFDVAKRMSENKESIEMACRELRYEWFEELKLSWHAHAVAVGHHREDKVETFFLNLMRGTGIDGLRGMKYRRDAIIRPLLDTSRQEIEDYLNDKGLKYIVDSSNASDDYQRNRLRNHVVPELLKYFPNGENAILSTMSNLSSAGEIFDMAIDSYREACEIEPWTFDLNHLAAMTGDKMAGVMYEILKSAGITASQCKDIVASKSKSGLVFDGRKGIVFELDRGVLRGVSCRNLVHRDEIAVDLSLDVLTPINIHVSVHDISEFSPTCSPDTIYIDEKAIGEGHSWQLRHWRKGDRIKPFGMRGSKLVSDLFADAKYSGAEKREAWLLTCDSEIVWVVGLRASRLHIVAPDTKKYLKLTLYRNK